MLDASISRTGGKEVGKYPEKLNESVKEGRMSGSRLLTY